MPEELPIANPDGDTVPVLLRDLRGLQSRLAGELIWPGHAQYEGARRLWNGLIDKRPGLIIRCAGEADVAASVRFVRDHDLELAVRGGGHNVAGRAMSEGGVVIDLSPMRRARVSADGRSVYADGGATLGDVDGVTLRRGLATPLGVVPATGVAGFTLHGGYGWLSRPHGLAVDNLVSARVVNAEGASLRAAPDENPELFWALRGGGGNFGVVTSFELRLHDIAPEVCFAVVVHPLERAESVLRVYRQYAGEAPDEVGLIAVFWSAPDLPQIPERARGSPVLILAAVYCGDAQEGERVLRPLSEAEQPLADLTSRTTFGNVQRFFEPDYPAGRRYYWKSAFLPFFSEELASAAIQRARERPSALSSIDLWGLGGAVSRVAVGETAFAARTAPFLLAIEANWDDASADGENVAWARRSFSDAAALARGQSYLNVPGFGEEGEALVQAAYGPNLDRLRRVKAKYDPDNLFHANFNISPAL